jgi:hypothetical protein
LITSSTSLASFEERVLLCPPIDDTVTLGNIGFRKRVSLLESANPSETPCHVHFSLSEVKSTMSLRAHEPELVTGRSLIVLFDLGLVFLTVEFNDESEEGDAEVLPRKLPPLAIKELPGIGSFCCAPSVPFSDITS